MSVVVLNASLDCWIDQTAITGEDVNHGADIISVVKNMNGTAKNRAITCFDTSSIPSNAIISSALFGRYCVTAAAGLVPCSDSLLTIYSGGDLLALPLVEAQTTWNSRFTGEAWQNAGGDIEAGVTPVAFNSPIVSLTQMADVEIATLINYARLTYAYPQMVGISTKQVSGTNRTWTFASKENILGYAVPTLTVTYTIPSDSTARPVVGGRDHKQRIRHF